MKESPAFTWLRLAREARAQMPPPPLDGPPPASFVARVLAGYHTARTAVPEGLLAFPGLGRIATLSASVALVCAVLVVASGGLADFTPSLLPDPEEVMLP